MTPRDEDAVSRLEDSILVFGEASCDYYQSIEVLTMSKSKRSAGRRNFLKGAAAGAAALIAKPPLAAAQQTRAAARPAEADAAVSTESVDVRSNEKPGSDFMLDVFKSLGFEY